MNLKNITDQLVDSTYAELLDLAVWCQSAANRKDPVRLREEAAHEAWLEDRRKAQEEKQAEDDRILIALKTTLKPGMKLKMKGCKDGSGIREFIRFDGGNLVCWQIKVQRQRIANGYYRSEERTNQVTTHMADKVQEIYVDGTGLKIKSILK